MAENNVKENILQIHELKISAGTIGGLLKK